MTGEHWVRATLTLSDSAHGGLTNHLPSGSGSLLLRFPTGDQSVTLGAAITPENQSELRPGMTDAPVVVQFWADEARAVAVPEAKFDVWYGRDVGRGKVLEVLLPT